MTRLVFFLLKQYAKYPWKTLLILVCALLSLAYQVTFSMSFQYLVDHILIPRRVGLILPFLFILCIGACIAAAANLLKDKLLTNLGTAVQNGLRITVLEHLQSLPVAFYRNDSSGIQSRFISDVNQVHTAFLSFESVFTAAVGLLVSSAFLATVDWRLSGLSFCGMLICYILPGMLSTRATVANDVLKSNESLYTDLLRERLDHYEVIRAYGLNRWELNRLKSAINQITPLSERAQLLGRFMNRSVSITLVLLNILIIALGAYLVVHGEVSVGMLVTFQSFYLNMSGYMSSLVNNLPDLNKTSVCLARIEKLFALAPSEAKAGFAPERLQLKHQIELCNISFSYDDTLMVLKDVNMSFPAASHCAVVGESGSGKTTIAKILLRFYNPDCGSLHLDDIDITLWPGDSVRSLIGYVPQDMKLFNLSLRDNIRLGSPDASDSDVEAAARLAGIDDWIASLPEGYDTVVGEQGRFLSGGQRQRLSIARALIRQSDLLLLDEATASLDPGTETLIYETIRGLVGSKLVISITHRLNTVVDATRIYVMDGGTVTDSGTHEELLERSQVYRRIWQKQSGFLISDDGRNASITVERLRQIPLFEELDLETLAEMKDLMFTETYNAGQTIVEQGTEGDSFYIIVRGSVEILQRPGLDSVVRLAVLDDGDHFGEMALLRRIPRTATVKAMSHCTLLAMRRERFHRTLEKSPALRAHLEDVFEQRMAQQTMIASLQAAATMDSSEVQTVG